MYILAPSPTAAPFPIAGAGSSAAPFDYASAFQNLSEGLETIPLMFSRGHVHTHRRFPSLSRGARSALLSAFGTTV